MSPPSVFQTLGFSLHLWKPSIIVTPGAVANTVTYNPRGDYLGAYQAEVESYSHTIQAMGGFWSADFSMRMKQADLEYWYGIGAGLHVEVYDEANMRTWEGRVNSVSFNIGGLSIVRGPVLDVANRVQALYTPVYSYTAPWTTGGPQYSAVVEDADSQSFYGVCYAELAAGEMKAAGAVNLCNAYLQERKALGSTKELDLSGAGDTPTAAFSCRGYAAWLNYPYAYSYYGADVNLSTKLAMVLNGDPNGFVSYDNALIATNTLQVPVEAQRADAWTIINDLVAMGDASYNRYVFGVYADRVSAYQAIPTGVLYYQHLSDTSGGIIGKDQAPVMPWKIRPGQWLQLSSFAAGTEPVTNPRNDPRCMFVEQITYTAPYDLKLQGGKTDRLSQLMSQSGLSGA